MKLTPWLILMKLFIVCIASRNPLKDTRIINGQKTSIQRMKYLVNLRLDGQFTCGGTLVSRRFVITAAHCVVGVRPGQLTVVGGSSFLNVPGVKRGVKKIIVAPQFNQLTLKMDVAVLKLSRPMVGKNTAPIKLCSHKLMTGNIVRVSGWGSTIKPESPPSNRVRTTVVRMLSRRKCKRAYRGKIFGTMMCAGFRGITDACTGDSGGPLIHKKQLCGIVSWGDGCAEKGKPGVYTNINAVKRFIKLAMKK